MHLRAFPQDSGSKKGVPVTKPIARDPIYRRRVFDAEIIELCIRWYITYRLSYRDLVAIMAERGVVAAHSHWFGTANSDKIACNAMRSKSL